MAGKQSAFKRNARGLKVTVEMTEARIKSMEDWHRLNKEERAGHQQNPEFKGYALFKGKEFVACGFNSVLEASKWLAEVHPQLNLADGAYQIYPQCEHTLPTAKEVG